MQNFSLVYQISEVDSGEIPRCNCISWMDGILYFIFTHCLCFPKTILFFFFLNSPVILGQLSLVVMHCIIMVVISVVMQQKGGIL